MNLKENIDLDLVFICSESVQKLQEFKKKDNKLLFESMFWKKIFSNWINIVIDKNISINSDIISNKKIFSLGFHLVDNNEISLLNKKWLNKTGPTDVISFPVVLENEFANDLLLVELGDLFVSLEMASSQSEEYDNSLKREMLFLVSHGFLHLLGWDHETEKKLKSMLNFQEYLISALN